MPTIDDKGGATFTDEDNGRVHRISADPEDSVNVSLQAITIYLTDEEKELWDYLELGVRRADCCGHPNLWHYVVKAAVN